MTIQLTPDIESAVSIRAQEQGTTPEAIVLAMLREALSQASPLFPSSAAPRDEWEAKLRRLASHCGVSLSNEAVSSEGLYEQHRGEI